MDRKELDIMRKFKREWISIPTNPRKFIMNMERRMIK